jgi:sterol 24-C-methyltransferase
MSFTGAIDKRSDGRVTDRIENYTKFWNADPLKEQDADNAKRLDSYTDVVNGQLHLFDRCIFSNGRVRLL